MAAIHYPNLRSHIEHHRALVKDVEAFHKSIAGREKINLTEVSSFLKDWLVRHVCAEDMKYKPYLTGDRKD